MTIIYLSYIIVYNYIYIYVIYHPFPPSPSFPFQLRPVQHQKTSPKNTQGSTPPVLRVPQAKAAVAPLVGFNCKIILGVVPLTALPGLVNIQKATWKMVIFP